jgi:peptidoglycan/LPS O-acetylase OafA/YrhL
MENQKLKHTYVPAFDGLRALVLVVMIAHLDGFFPIIAPHRRLHALLITQVWYSLNVFFVLSGFLITWLLSSELQKTGDVNLARFYKRRTARLLPAYATAITAGVIVALCWGHAPGGVFRELPYFLTYSYNMFVSLPGVTAPILSAFLVPVWSLCVEEQFYLSWSLALRRLTLRRALPAVIGVLIVQRLYRCALFFWMQESVLRNNRFYYGTDTRIDAILWGCAAALALQHPRYFEVARKYLKARSLPYLLPVGIAVTLFFSAKEIIWSPAYQAYGADVTGVLLATWLVAIVFQPDSYVSRILGFRPITFVGRISYGIYVFHLIVAQVVARALDAGNGPFSTHRNSAGWLIVSTVSILFATAHFYLIEKPLMSGAKSKANVPIRTSPSAIEAFPQTSRSRRASWTSVVTVSLAGVGMVAVFGLLLLVTHHTKTSAAAHRYDVRKVSLIFNKSETAKLTFR